LNEDPANIRTQVVDFLRRELVGPDPRPEHLSLNEGDEILRPQDPPRLRYSAGVLFPGGATVAEQEVVESSEVDLSTPEPEPADEPDLPEGQEEPDLLGEAASPGSASDPDEATEHEVNRANEFLPSAMGLSALIRLPPRLKVTVKAAVYEKRTLPNLGRQTKEGQWQAHHFRQALSLPPVEIDCSLFSPSKPVVRDFPVDIGKRSEKLSVHVFSRPYVDAQQPDSDRIITFTLINRTDLSGDKPKDSECFFQCGFSVESTDGAACFLEYPDRVGAAPDDESESLRLLYRHRRTFAVGHGCAAEWEQEGFFNAPRIRTETLPTYDIKPVLPREIAGLTLSMRDLSAQEGSGPVETCRRLVAEYGKWIETQKGIMEGPEFPVDHREAARRHLKLCDRCLIRIEDGVDLLENPATRRAFAWMNEAMLLQQLHYEVSTKGRRTWSRDEDEPTLAPFERPNPANPSPKKGRWRPFQLAFILMNLRSVSQRDSDDRNLVDLIWFPTGGGKTEAYLGLTAFTIFWRRLANLDDAGTTVLMRYTLRLLTTQQFQRAASLICACEIIRRSHESTLGRVRISAGLWVGGSVTPNTNEEATAALNKLAKSGSPNPFVVLTCPWCGAEMGPVRVRDYYKVKGYKREAGKVVFRCEDAKCDFHDTHGLPLHVVDQTIYEERPTLVIGTVDKFAMLPWLKDAGGRRLFGLDKLSPVSPPDLIIQDELHLISGALGSMVGMYESTIDALCRHKVGGKSMPAKVVASTATICKAGEQVHSLYARKVFLFPPQGLRAGDSFFAEESLSDENGNPRTGRLYLGVFGTALSSHVTAQIRVVAALLQAVKCIKASDPKDLDPYWTLMAYFNSLRELGHAATLIRADIREYLNAVWDRLEIRKPKPDSGQPDLRRFINRDLELTSRIQSSQITEVLQQLFNHYPGTQQQRPVDVCLATNMIQVGLDVSRLGLMTVIGQPKTTAEYIQATSRVGRDGPGLVVTIYNTGKPRDRSHFEHFRAYHQSIYRWVEPTSVTPFAIPVRERALHAQLITLLRYWGVDAVESLRNSPRPAPSDELYRRVREVLIERVKLVDKNEAESAGEMLDKLMKVWRTILPPKYGQFGPPPMDTPLMYPSGTEPRAIWADRAKSTPSSMRNVDAGCDAKVITHFPR
jgi:hypothetical protein